MTRYRVSRDRDRLLLLRYWKRRERPNLDVRPISAGRCLSQEYCHPETSRITQVCEAHQNRPLHSEVLPNPFQSFQEFCGVNKKLI
jgi:hypothetical protein